jgi:hypothetical protein
MRTDGTDLAVVVLPHADANINEAPGERLRIVSIEVGDHALESLLAEEVQSHERHRSCVIFLARLPPLLPESGQVKVVENPTFCDRIAHQVSYADVSVFDSLVPQSPVTYDWVSTED